MTNRNYAVLVTLFALAGGLAPGAAIAEEHDYYKYVRPPTKPLPEVGRNKVEQEGGPNAVGYKRRTVQWWPRKGQDIIDIPEGAPLREWTRNKGQEDAEALAGFCRTWKSSDPVKFKAHLVAFRSFGTSTPHTGARHGFISIPIAILRMEDGTQRGVHNARFYSPMVSREDHDFIQKEWEKAFPKLYAKTLQDEALTKREGVPGGHSGDFELKYWTAARPRFYAMDDGPMHRKYPRWGRKGFQLAFETPHFHIIAQPRPWGGPWTMPANWIQPKNIERQNQYRKGAMEHIENLWTYVEACGGSMPYWRWQGPNYKFIIHSHRNRAAGGVMHCGISDVNRAGIGHEFFHSMPAGGWGGMYYETWCNAGQHTTAPGEFQMFPGNFCFNWRNVNRYYYQSSFWAFMLGDNPNWGHGAPVSIASLGATAEPTPYHSVARLGQKKGLWKNGIRGWGDWWGEYAARMVTVDGIEKYIVGSRYGMPELSCVYPVYGRKNGYRITHAEAPRFPGYNIIRLEPADGAKEIAVDFQGFEDPELRSDWRACLVAVDGEGRARYSALWNKGPMRFELKPSDMHLWLTVSGSPSAFPIRGKGVPGQSYGHSFLLGNHTPRYPWEITLTGCRPGAPHRRQGDVGNFDDLYCISNYGNKFLDLPIKWEAPIPPDHRYGDLAQKKLVEMRPRIQAGIDVINEKVRKNLYAEKGWWVMRKMGILNDMARRARFLQTEAKGRRHPNGGGFVAESASVAKSAYVGPDAMVLDGATVKDNACVKGFAVVLGPKTVVSGNAKVDGRCWVFGDIRVGGNARILEAATVTTIRRGRYGQREGKAEIAGNAVIKGDGNVWLHGSNITATGGVVVDYTSDIDVGRSCVGKHGRFCNPPRRWGRQSLSGVDAGQLYASWQFNQPKATLLEDSYVNNNGILYGRPQFADDGEHRYIAFNGKDQYAEAPPSVADFGALTIDMSVKRAAGKGGRLFDFGTGEDECFYLSIGPRNGKVTLIARHKGKTYTLVASQGIAADKWARVRVEMDGSKASIYIDGKNAGKGKFTFRPRMVFIADLPEGNFIACGRKKDDFFTGRMDHFRIYRKVHDDFASLGPPPAPLTQKQEWSEKDQELADLWDGKRRAAEAAVRADEEYVKIQADVRKLHEQKSALYKAESLKKFEAAIREADKARQELDRRMHEKLKAVLEAGKEIEKKVQELRKKIEDINRRIREDAAYVKLGQEIQALEKQRGEVERQVSEMPKLKAMRAKAEAPQQAKRKAEERVRQLPDLKKAKALAGQEKDGGKRRQLQEKYNRLYEAKKLADAEWLKADVAGPRLRGQYDEALRKERERHEGRRKLAQQIQDVRGKRGALEEKLRKAHPLAALQKAIVAKQAPLQELQAKRREVEQKARAADDYKKAQEVCAAARKALDEERKRIREAKAGEAAKLDARIGELHKKSQALRDNALKKAGVFGANPYPGTQAAKLKAFQESLIWHTSADWDYRIGPELTGKAPPKMKEWLKRMRGY